MCEFHPLYKNSRLASSALKRKIPIDLDTTITNVNATVTQTAHRYVELVLSLLGKLGLDGLLPLLQLALSLETHNSTAPLPLEAFVEQSVEISLQGVELALILFVNLSQAQDRRVLLVHHSTKAGLD